MLKPSHFRTPRTMGECHFQPGYRPALPRDSFEELGHWLLNCCMAGGCVVLVVLLAAGVL